MAKRDGTIKATLMVTLIVLISKGVGFIREIIMGAYYGTGWQMDAYSSAYSIYYIPILLFSSCITSTMIPLYIKTMSESSLRRANRFASNVLNLFIIFSLMISAVMYLATGPLVGFFFRGFSPEKAALTVELTRIMMPSLVFSIMSIVLASILNARERYTAAQLTGFPITACIIVATVLFSERYGIQALAWGVALAAVLQVVILIPSLSKVFRYSSHFSLKDPRFRRLILLATPAMLSMAVNELNHMVNKMLAAPLPDGNLAAMDFASRLITFLTGVLLVPVVTVMFSRMSQKATERGGRAVIELLMRSMEVMALVILPIIAICMVFNGDIIRAAYMRGNFRESSVALTAPVFAFYALGLLGFGMRDLLTRAFNALQDTRTPMLIAGGTVGLNVALNLLLIGPMGINGLALATSISAICGALVLFILIRKQLGHMGGRRTLEEMLKIGIATVLCAFACLMLNRVMPQASTWSMSLLRLAACAALAGVVYIGAVLAAGVRQMTALIEMVRHRLGRRHK